ncbi:uncharacterized protein V1510DRAFT_448406 [Dipodascopsis tothii]|uniref:uncharacterized protein n=1 Tax=Dipodascopsis tothii TaxID=44089 RepID=UPI0034CF4314
MSYTERPTGPQGELRYQQRPGREEGQYQYENYYYGAPYEGARALPRMRPQSKAFDEPAYEAYGMGGMPAGSGVAGMGMPAGLSMSMNSINGMAGLGAAGSVPGTAALGHAGGIVGEDYAAGYGLPQMPDDSMDPQLYAALQAKQKDLMATSMYIAQQQQRIQAAMYAAMQQQPAPEGYSYVQDANGNIWYHPVAEPYTKAAYGQTNGFYDSFGGKNKPKAYGQDPALGLAQGRNKAAHRKSTSMSVTNGNLGAYLSKSPAGYKKPTDERRQSFAPGPGGLGLPAPSANGRKQRPMSMIGPSAESPLSSGASTPSSVLPEGHPMRQPSIPVSVDELRRSPETNFHGAVVAQRSWLPRAPVLPVAA